jgi:hypothetical protein
VVPEVRMLKHHSRQLLQRMGLEGKEKHLLQWPLPPMMRGIAHTLITSLLLER